MLKSFKVTVNELRFRVRVRSAAGPGADVRGDGSSGGGRCSGEGYLEGANVLHFCRSVAPRPNYWLPGADRSDVDIQVNDTSLHCPPNPQTICRRSFRVSDRRSINPRVFISSRCSLQRPYRSIRLSIVNFALHIAVFL